MRFIIAGLLLLAGWVGAPQAENPPLQFAELGDLELVGGGVLEDVRLGYRTAGELNADGSNAILFPTWFGGTSGQLLAVWSPWIDTDRFFLIIVDALGNGVSTSPSNSEAQPGQSFPRIGIRDMVNSQHRLLTEVLNVVGLQDHMVTPWPALRFAELLGAESISLDSDCGHLASSCEAAIVIPRVREFLGR